MIIMLVDANYVGIIIMMMMNITTLVHTDTKGLARPITMITGGDTGPVILGIVITMILKMTPGTAMVNAYADPTRDCNSRPFATWCAVDAIYSHCTSCHSWRCTTN